MLVLSVAELRAQCSILPNAFEYISLRQSISGTNNRSGLAYNPAKQYYYSVNAGSSGYPIDTYNASGVLLDSTASGFDYRGAWWNPSINVLEGNGFSTGGIFIQTLAAGTAFPTGTGTTTFTANQPDAQSVGDLDYNSNEIIYYNDGFIYRYSRVDNGLLGSFLILNLPVAKSALNSNSVVYTGCPQHEIGVYDYGNQRLLFIDKANGQYNGFCQLPATAPQRSSFGMSYANNLLWLFDNNLWTGYQVANLNTAIDPTLADQLRVSPNPVRDILHISADAALLPGSVTLMNLQGQELISQSFNQVNSLDIDVATLPAGAYLVRVVSGESIAMKKVLKLN